MDITRELKGIRDELDQVAAVIAAAAAKVERLASRVDDIAEWCSKEE